MLGVGCYRVRTVMESHGILKVAFPGLESHGILSEVMEKSWNSRDRAVRKKSDRFIIALHIETLLNFSLDC